MNRLQRSKFAQVKMKSVGLYFESIFSSSPFKASIELATGACFS